MCKNQHTLLQGANKGNQLYTRQKAFCNLCNRDVAVAEAWSCPPCEYDLCIGCYSQSHESCSSTTPRARSPAARTRSPAPLKRSKLKPGARQVWEPDIHEHPMREIAVFKSNICCDYCKCKLDGKPGLQCKTCNLLVTPIPLIK